MLSAGTFYLVNLAPASFSRLTGQGRGVTIVNNDGANPVFNLGASQTDSVEIDHLTLSATGANIFGGSAVNCIRWHVHHCALTQLSAGFSIWAASAVTLMIECTFNNNTERVSGATRSVPAWSLNSAGTDLVTQCIWEKNVCFNTDSDATQWYFSLICSAANALLRNNTFRDLTFEHACGGMIHLESVSGTLIENCWSWDTPASSILQPSVNIIKNSGNSAVPAGNTIIASGRVGDGLNTGIADIKLDANCTGTTIQDCGAFGTAVVYVIDTGGSANLVLIGLQSTVSLLNAIAGHIRMYNGAYLGNSGKFQQAASGGLILQVQDTTSTPTSPIAQFQAQAAGDKTLGLIVAGDTNPRAIWDSNGKLSLGPGNATQDTTLGRTAAGQLGVNGNPIIWGGLFGDGSDGAATLDGTATVPWASKVGSVYTMTRPAFLTSLTINSGSSLVSPAYTIFVAGPVINNGTIGEKGFSGAASGTAGGVTGSGSYAGGRAGGAGGINAGTAATSTGGGGGAGATGGAGSSGAAGAGAAGTTTTAGWYRSPIPSTTGLFQSFSSTIVLAGGQGGGGGSGDATNSGGGGGGGGPLVVIFAWSVVNNGQILANGGDGGSPTAGNTGGGGAGGGGLILVYTLSALTGTGTTNVSAGAPGTSHGTGAAPGTAAAGTYANIILQ
jgi:hypothetical protein